MTPSTKTYAIFDRDGCLAFFDHAASKRDALDQLIKDDESYSDLSEDDWRIQELNGDETALMKQWYEGGQKTHEWPFDWTALNARSA